MFKKMRASQAAQASYAAMVESDARVAPKGPEVGPKPVSGELASPVSVISGRNPKNRSRQNRRYRINRALRLRQKMIDLLGKDVWNRLSRSDQRIFASCWKANEALEAPLSPADTLTGMLAEQDDYRRTSEILIETYPDGLDLRNMVAPLAIGTFGYLVAKHPELDGRFINRFLSWTTSRLCYLEAISRGVRRRTLDGTLAEPITREEQENALKIMKGIRNLEKRKPGRAKAPSIRSLRYLYGEIPRHFHNMAK